jgi:hypothetical protein
LPADDACDLLGYSLLGRERRWISLDAGQWFASRYRIAFDPQNLPDFA